MFTGLHWEDKEGKAVGWQEGVGVICSQSWMFTEISKSINQWSNVSHWLIKRQMNQESIEEYEYLGISEAITAWTESDSLPETG